MALQPEIRTDSLAGQLSDSLPTTETALRESIFRLRDSLATIPPDTLQATPPVTAEELFGAGSTLAIEPFPTQSRSEERRVGKECRSRWSPYH